YDVRAPGSGDEAIQPLGGGLIQGVGGLACLTFAMANGEAVRQAEWIECHGDAARRVLGWLGSVGALTSLAAVGYAIAGTGPRSHASRLVGPPLAESLREIADHLGPKVPLNGVA